jgi:CDP-diacylglycerol--glycerol-3-phosphate 3-phosphatidyltransferase
MVLFIIAAGTDWLDGYFARKYNQVTTLGRILDPFADKVIICGTFIYLAAIPEMRNYLWPSMAVIVVGRELLVTALRSFIEEQGGDFSAQMSGKLKMVLQCIAAGVSLFYLSALGSDSAATPQIGQQIVAAVSNMTHLAPSTWLLVLQWAMIGFIWSAVLMTVWSGVGYIVTAVRLLRA